MQHLRRWAEEVYSFRPSSKNNDRDLMMVRGTSRKRPGEVGVPSTRRRFT